MADFNLLTKFTITDIGMNLITRGMAESKAIIFTAVKCADGITTLDPTKVVNLIGTNILNMSIASVDYDATDQTASVTATMTNAGVTSNKVITEYGIYAKCTGDVSDVLFGYKNNKDTPDVLYPYGTGDQYIEREFKCGIGAFSNLGDNFSYDYANAKNVEAVYLKKMLMGLLGVAQHSVLDDLPDNTGNWGWFDGGEIKKVDYPDLWLRVKPSVDAAIANVTAGTWEYLGSNNMKSYFGWYKGTTDEYFRKPNFAGEHYMRPVNPASGRKGGVFQAMNIQSHNHDASSAGAGSHNHTGTTSTDGDHRHFTGISYDNNNRGPYVSWGQQNIDNTAPIYTDYQGLHAHTFTTSTASAHTHTITVADSGGVETTPTNIAVKVYGLLRF